MSRRLASIALVATLAACSGGLESPTSPPSSAQQPGASALAVASGASASPSASAPHAPDGMFDVGGHRLRLACAGEGSPTVVFEAGLDSAGTTWLTIQAELAKRTTVCRYDRAGLGSSDARLGGRTETAAGVAGELWTLLEAAGIGGPIVLAGHSFGGMTVRIAAHDHPDAVRGLVLIDASSVHQFEEPWLSNDAEWSEGGSVVDRVTSAAELRAVTSLGDIPLVVLTQGRMSGSFVADWSRAQDELATLSTDALHVVAKDSGHMIPEEASALVVATVADVVDAVRSGGRLPACGPRLEAAGAECLATTMSDQVTAWQALRASVVPAAGPFPPGTYRAELSAAVVEDVSGEKPDWKLEVQTWTLADGRWSLEIVDDGGSPDRIDDVYMAAKDELVVRLPDDWSIPRTPGVNRLRWSVDGDGTIRFTQIDTELREPAFTVPWTWTGPAPSG